MDKKHFSIAEKSLQNIRLMLTERSNFANEVKKLRQEYLKSKLLAKDKLANLLKITEKIENLIKKYKLSAPHFIPLTWIVLYNDKEQNEIEKLFNKNFYKTIPDEYGGKTIYIPIYPETTIDDIREILPSVKSAYGNSKKARMRKISKTSLTILEMASAGHNNSDIKTEINNNSESGKEIIKPQIPTIKYKFKKAKNKRILNNL